MSLPTQKTSSDFTFKHSGQVDAYGASVGDYTTVQSNFDSRAIYNQTQINAIIAALQSLTDSDSGADCIGATPIPALGAQNTVQAILEAIVAAGTGSIPPDNSITQAKMTDGSIGTDELINGSVTFAKFASRALAWDNVATSGTITTATSLTIPSQAGKSEMMLQFRESSGNIVYSTVILPLNASGIPIPEQVNMMSVDRHNEIYADERNIWQASATSISIGASSSYGLYGTTWLQKLYVFTR